MALTTVIILTWLVAIIFYVTPKKLSFMQNFIVFMILAILSRNLMTILTMELKWIETSEEPVVNMFFIFQRELIIPIATLFFINVYYRLKTRARKVLLFLGVLMAIHSLDYLAIYFGVVEYKQWNYLYDLLHEVAYLLIGLGLSKLVISLKKKESIRNGSHLL